MEITKLDLCETLDGFEFTISDLETLQRMYSTVDPSTSGYKLLCKLYDVAVHNFAEAHINVYRERKAPGVLEPK